MAITYIEVDTSKLNSDISEQKSEITQARNRLKTLKSELDALNAMWKGSANLAFQNAVTQDYSKMQNMLTTLEKLASCMENAKKEYNSCEQSVKSTVNSIRI